MEERAANEQYLGRVVNGCMDESNPEDRKALRQSWNKNKEHMEPVMDVDMSEEVSLLV